MYEYHICTVRDDEITCILIHGSFVVVTRIYVLVKTDFSEDFRFSELAKELEGLGLDPRKTRLICIAVNVSETVKDAEKYPEIRIRHDPF